jgi:hypothetical protein
MLFDAGVSRRPEICVMASAHSAHVIEVGDIAAGIVVLEQGGFRFFAAERAFHPLEGALFRTLDQATRAARERLSPRKKPGGHPPSSNLNGAGNSARAPSGPLSRPF